MTGRNYVFVYGTLKKNRGNDYLLEKSNFVGKALTEDSFVMTTVGFPYLIRTEDAPGLPAHRAFGELYEVDERTLDRLDGLEGFYGSNDPYNHYNRNTIKVMSECGDAYETFVYICNVGEEDYASNSPLVKTEEIMGQKAYVF